MGFGQVHSWGLRIMLQLHAISCPRAVAPSCSLAWFTSVRPFRSSKTISASPQFTQPISACQAVKVPTCSDSTGIKEDPLILARAFHWFCNVVPLPWKLVEHLWTRMDQCIGVSAYQCGVIGPFNCCSRSHWHTG